MNEISLDLEKNNHRSVNFSNSTPSTSGVNIIKNVNSSNLPTNIKNAHQIFENPVILSKLKAGPIDPSAGPTLPNEAADPPIDDIKSKP